MRIAFSMAKKVSGGTEEGYGGTGALQRLDPGDGQDVIEGSTLTCPAELPSPLKRVRRASRSLSRQRIRGWIERCTPQPSIIPLLNRVLELGNRTFLICLCRCKYGL
jgi:hypothetical protein